MSIEVSIITINYNGLADTCALIDSIPFNDESLEVIVVDNASKTDEASLYPALRTISLPLNACPEVAAEINRALDKFGNVKDSASPLLADLRRQLASLQGSVSGILRRVIAEGRSAGYFDGDVQPSMRDGRLVLPVAPMHKRKVKGIVHDESASGKING